MILLADLVVLAAGYGLLRIVARDADLGIAGALGLSWLAGTTALAFVTTLAGVTGLPTTPAVLAPPLVLLALAPVRPWRVTRADLVPGAIALALGTRLALAAAHVPTIRNDEYAIWALHGRALARAGRLDPRIFTNTAAFYQHLDYPLLVPGVIAWSDRWGGNEHTAHVQVALLAVALLLTIAWGVTRLAGRLAAIVAVVAAVVPTGFAFYALKVMGDVPTAAYGTALALVLALWLRDDETWQWRVATILATGALYTKNEGGAFALAACLAAAAVAPSGRRLIPLGVFARAVIAYLPWILWTKAHHLSNDVVNGGSVHRAATVSAHRLSLIAHGMAHRWPLPGWWWWLFVAAVVLAVRAGGWRIAAYVTATLALALLALGAIYVVTPLDVQGHIDSSAHRVQLFPAVLLAVAIPVLASAKRGEPHVLSRR